MHLRQVLAGAKDWFAGLPHEKHRYVPYNGCSVNIPIVHVVGKWSCFPRCANWWGFASMIRYDTPRQEVSEILSSSTRICCRLMKESCHPEAHTAIQMSSSVPRRYLTAAVGMDENSYNLRYRFRELHAKSNFCMAETGRNLSFFWPNLRPSGRQRPVTGRTGGPRWRVFCLGRLEKDPGLPTRTSLRACHQSKDRGVERRGIRHTRHVAMILCVLSHFVSFCLILSRISYD